MEHFQFEEFDEFDAEPLEEELYPITMTRNEILLLEGLIKSTEFVLVGVGIDGSISLEFIVSSNLTLFVCGSVSFSSVL